MKLGLYRHYKGKLYRAILLSERDGDRELLVTYIPLYDIGMPTTRTVREFTEIIYRENYDGSRFEFVSE